VEDQEGRVSSSSLNLAAKRHRDTGALRQGLFGQPEPAAGKQYLVAQIRKDVDAVHKLEASQLC